MPHKLQTLYEMLTYKRPRGGATEGEYINRFLRPLGVRDDRFGNLHLTIGDNPTVLWSSHTDTVHTREGHQRIELIGHHVGLAAGDKSSCLGADCAAGNWIMREMILARVPGLYIFHFGEETGQIGSNKIRTDTPDVLAGIQAAIAFDRRGTSSVITHQRVRTCSDAFGNSLIEQLPGFRLDDGGTVTDTKVYRGLVPECTNLSVGYSREHSPAERLDVAHIAALREAMLKIDPSRFVIERKPEFEDTPRLAPFDDWMRDRTTRPIKPSRRVKSKSLHDLLADYPTSSADVLEELGLTYETLAPLITRKRQAHLRERLLFDDDETNMFANHALRKIA